MTRTLISFIGYILHCLGKSAWFRICLLCRICLFLRVHLSICDAVRMYVKIVRIGHTVAKITNIKKDVCRFWYLSSNDCNYEKCIPWPWPTFWWSKLKMFVSLKLEELAQTFLGGICRFENLQSNCEFAKIALRDLVLLFGNHFF